MPPRNMQTNETFNTVTERKGIRAEDIKALYKKHGVTPILMRYVAGNSVDPFGVIAIDNGVERNNFTIQNWVWQTFGAQFVTNVNMGMSGGHSKLSTDYDDWCFGRTLAKMITDGEMS